MLVSLGSELPFFRPGNPMLPIVRGAECSTARVRVIGQLADIAWVLNAREMLQKRSEAGSAGRQLSWDGDR